MRLVLRPLNIIISLTILLISGCAINNEGSKPEFIEELYQREQLPDSVGLEARIEIRRVQNDSIHVEFFITNEKKTDQVIGHSGNFANIFVYKNSELILPVFDPSKMVYHHDYNESVIPAQDQIQVSTINLNESDFKGAKAVGFAPLKIKRENTKGFSANAVLNSEEYWLVTSPITIE
ncbi:MAG: hypothetical protein GVY07_04075 [Bacteroidetes bacterium]|jgi:hypothetical protein|nr:hypothetical protein [Bacteroidota bacterium]